MRRELCFSGFSFAKTDEWKIKSMKTNDFMSNLLQVVGFIAAIILALSQYFFSGEFKFFFASNEKLYSISNVVSLILSLAIIIGLYSVRYIIDNRNYFSTTKRDLYWKKIQEIKTYSQKDQIISEPWYWTISRLGFLLILISLSLYGLLVSSTNIYLTSISYVLFICTSVASLTIFSLKIYLPQEFKNMEERIRKQTLDKVNEYFAGNLHILSELEDRSNMMYPVRILIIEKDGKKYIIRCDANNPDKFFNIEEQKTV